MALDTSYNGPLAVNRLPINLKQIKKDACVVCSWWSPFRQRCRLCERPYSAHPTGVVLRHIVLQGWLAGVSPRAEGLLALVGLGIAGLLSQVVKLEGDFVVGVKEAPVTQVSVLCYQNLCRTVKSSVFPAVRSGVIVAKNGLVHYLEKHMPDRRIRQFWQEWTGPCCIGQTHCIKTEHRKLQGLITGFYSFSDE